MAVLFALTRAGTEWVLVFFVLSGFLVGGRMIERLKRGSFNMGDYIVDRISRIWVPLIPAIICSGFVAFWTGKTYSWTGLLGKFTGLQGILCHNFAETNPLWSLAYEIWFYFIAGCVALCLTCNRSRVWTILALGIGFAVFTKLQAVFLFAWLLGATTYDLCRRPRNALLAGTGFALTVIGYAFSQLNSATVSIDVSNWLWFIPSSDVATLT